MTKLLLQNFPLIVIGALLAFLIILAHQSLDWAGFCQFIGYVAAAVGLIGAVVWMLWGNG